MSNLLQTGAEFEKAERESRIYRDNAERRVQQARKSVSKAVTSNETKIKDAIALFTTSTEESLETPEGVKRR